MAQEKKPEKFTIPLPEDAPAPAPQQEAPKKASRPLTTTGFAQDALNDAFDLLKGLYQIIPSSVKSYQQNVPYILKNIDALTPGMVGKAAAETAKGIGESLVAGPKEHGWEYPLRRPVSFTLDLASVLTLGGGTAAKVGRLAGGTMNGAGKASDLVRAGTYLQELPGKVARSAVDKTVLKVSGGNWDLAKRREALFLKRNEQSRKLVMTEEDAKAFGAHAGKMSDEEAAILDKFIRQGATPAEMAAHPNAAGAFQVLKKLDAETWRPYLLKSRFKTEAELERALAKKYAYEVWGDTTKAKVDEAAQVIHKLREAEKRGEALAPVYAPHIPEGKVKGLRADDLVDDLVSGGRVKQEGAVGALEEFGGKARKYVKDPRKYVPAAIYAFRDLEAKTRFSSRLLQNKELITGKGDGLTTERLFHGNPEGVYRKYYEDNIRSQALAKITDPTIQRLLRWEYIRTQNGVIRLYDRVMQLFAKMATRWNPKWQTGNVIGDAVLGTLMGSDWAAGLAARKSGRLPYEAIARGGAGGVEGVQQLARTPKWVDRAFEIGEAADKATRAGIITREAARRLEAVGYKVEASMDTLDDVLMSSREFSDVQVALQQIEEEVARRSVNVQRIDKVIAALEKREEALSRKLLGRDLRQTLASREKFERANLKVLQEGATERNWVKAKTAEEAIPLGATGSPAFEKGMNDLNVLRQRLVNLQAKRRAIIRDIADDMAKKGALDARMPDLKRQVEILRPAIERQNAAIGDYLGLDGFEQGVMKRVIPFYPWAKAMTMLAFRVPFLAPVKTMLWHRMSQFLFSMAEDPELPDWTKGRVPIFALKDGRQVWVNVASFSPFGGLSQTKFGDIPIPQMLNVVERNPMVALGFRYYGGRTVWDASAVPYGEPMVNMHDGTVVEFTRDGMLKKVIPQTPLVQGLVHFFPTTQLVEQILTPYWTNKYNWAGIPEPIYNPDGSYKYPKELWDRLSAAVGLSVMTRSPEDLKRSERRRVHKALSALKDQYRRTSDQDEREMIRAIMRDYVSENKYRKFKAS